MKMQCLLHTGKTMKTHNSASGYEPEEGPFWSSAEDFLADIIGHLRDSGYLSPSGDRQEPKYVRKSSENISVSDQT